MYDRMEQVGMEWHAMEWDWMGQDKVKYDGMG